MAKINELPAATLVVVLWDDAWTTETPATMDGHLVHKPERITTLGWLMKDDEIGVQLANEFYDNTYRGRTFIPRAMVVKVTPFRLAQQRVKKEKPIGE
jgi:hypothetical protein